MRAAGAGGVLLAVALLAGVYQVAGAFDAVLACGVGWAVTLLLLRLRLPRPHPPSGDRRAGQPSSPSSWPSVRAVENRLWPALRSPRLYDHATRPLLSRVTAVLLEHHTGIRLAEEPARARAVLGDDVWRLVDPAIVPSQVNRPPGVPLETLDMLLTRLEEL